MPGILSPAECRRILKTLDEGATWKRGQTAGGITDHRTSDVAWLHLNDPAWTWLKRRMDEGVAKANESYGVNIAGGTDVLQATRYTDGQQYKAHMDRGPQWPDRSLSCSVLLEAGEDGGAEMEFSVIGAPVDVKPGEGLVFRADERHAARPVQSGRRTSLVAWYREGSK